MNNSLGPKHRFQCGCALILMSLFGALNAGCVGAAGNDKEAMKPKLTIVAQGQFFGFCEASAIIPWKGGYLVADNEAEDNLYAFDADMKPDDYHFKPQYEVRDVEALVELASKQVALIGSHSTDSDGEPKPKRSLVQVEGSKSRLLDLSACAACTAARASAPKRGGLSIEGAAMWNAKLWLGVRSPLSHGKALLLQMSTDLASDGPVTVEKIIAIDLNGRGIRDLAVRDGKLFVLAGPLGDVSEPHALYRLADSTGVVELIANGLPERSEGIAPTPAVNEWLIVTDGNGKPDSPCAVPSEWFRVRL